MTLKKEQEILTANQNDLLACVGEIIPKHKEVILDLPDADLKAFAHKLCLNLDESLVLSKLQKEIAEVRESAI